jgi:hypothetical protein
MPGTYLCCSSTRILNFAFSHKLEPKQLHTQVQNFIPGCEATHQDSKLPTVIESMQETNHRCPGD